MFALGGVAVVLAAFTGWVAWQAQGLEARILAEIQPHLATDVHIEGLEVSLLAAWPDVEVQLRGVRIADALDPQRDFLSMERVDLRVACWPLLEGKLEVKSLGLSQGAVSVRRESATRENWKFWKDQEGAETGLSEWRIDALTLEEVEVAGDWTGSEDRIQWQVAVSTADLAVSVVPEGGLRLSGTLDLPASRLQVGEDTWLDEVGVAMEIEGRMSGGDATFQFSDAALTRAQKAVNLEGGVEVKEGRFGLALSALEVEWDAVDAVLPPVLRPSLSEGVSRIRGKGGLDVVVSHQKTTNLTMAWPGPTSEAWKGGWAVRANVAGTRILEQGQVAAIQSGAVVAYETRQGWRAETEAVRASVAGGELEIQGEAGGNGQRWDIEADARGIFRPAALSAWAGPAVTWPEGWSLADEGQVSVEGGFHILGDGRGGVTWEAQEGAKVTAQDLRWMGQGAQCGVGAVDFVWNGSGWRAECVDIRVPGAQAQATLSCENEGQLDVSLDGLEVDPFLAVLDQWSTLSASTGNSGSARPWDVTVSCGPLRYGSFAADEVRMTGRWAAEQFNVTALDADAMGGQWSGTGTVDRFRVDFDGRMAGVDLPSFLEATDGLGQATLLPRHVRGRAWAEGHVGYAFQSGSGQPWDAQVTARVEDGELIEFDLLQEIPAALEADRKSRWIADAEDMRRRLRRVHFEPLVVEVEFKRDVLTLEPVTVESDAMDVGVEGWYRLGGRMDFTLDFALRDLKSGEGELGTMEEDGLGHRFFLAVGGTLEEPEFGYDRKAHQSHRREQRQGAWSRLKGALQGADAEEEAPPAAPIEGASAVPVVELTAPGAGDSAAGAPRSAPVPFEDDDDDF